MARSWHFFAAWIFVVNGIVYFAYGLATGHLCHAHEVADSLDGIGGGQGGYWENQGFQWYAGV